MIKIAICDDEPLICKEIAETIENQSGDFLESIRIAIYTNGESLYEDLGKGHYFDLIFLDINLYEINGIDIGVYIRRNLDNQLSQIVFVSSKQEYTADLFAIHPLDFLVKPIDPKQVIHCLTLTLKMGQRDTKCFSYQTKGTTKRIPLSDIYYFESNARKIRLVFAGGEDTFYGKLCEIYEQIKAFSFLYIHKSYVVNYLWVKCCTYHEMVFENGKILPISRSMQKEVFKRIAEIRAIGKDSGI